MTFWRAPGSILEAPDSILEASGLDFKEFLDRIFSTRSVRKCFLPTGSVWLVPSSIHGVLGFVSSKWSLHRRNAEYAKKAKNAKFQSLDKL